MTEYKILPRTYKIAENNNIIIYPSENLKYKIEVYRDEDGKFLGYIGDNSYLDYPYYLLLEKNGYFKKGHAEKRREIYYQRHHKDKSLKGILAKKLLW
jgi:hypothetical protein